LLATAVFTAIAFQSKTASALAAVDPTTRLSINAQTRLKIFFIALVLHPFLFSSRRSVDASDMIAMPQLDCP